ncbi:MAG: M48 family metalloprotease [Hydrogenothermaceae bacterium]|nr:M48 family metalloprotease [Hydrogenothermaceae bacterium]
MKKSKYILKLACLLLFGFTFTSCTQVEDPLTGQKTFSLISTQQEIEIGKKYIPQAINENEGLYPDKEVQNYIRKIGYRIAEHTPRKVDYQFYLVNSKDVNAFALPGGPVFVNRGIILILDNESELAGVLAHELGHINARHHAKFLEKTYGLNVILNILAIATSNSQYQNLILQTAQIGAGLIQLKYSRDQESEADTLGVRFAYESGYDPRGLISTFEKFKKLERESKPTEWLLTHPLPDSRIKNVSQLIEMKYQDKLLLKKDSPEFQQIKQKIVKTALSYDYVEKAKESIKNKDFNAAIKHLNSAINLYEENNSAYTYKAFVCYQIKDFDCAYKSSVYATKIDNLYFLPKLLAGASAVKLGKDFEAIKILEEAKNLINTSPDLYYFLGVAYQNIGNKQKAYENLKAALEITDGKRGWEADAKQRILILTR